MLGAGDHAAVPEAEVPEAEPNADDNRPSDELVADPGDMTPLCGEEEFAAILENIVADEAPRLFAVVQEYGERVNGRIAAWGMAFEDHADVIGVDRPRRICPNLPTPENALRHFAQGPDIHARLVWFNPDAATPEEDDDEAA